MSKNIRDFVKTVEINGKVLTHQDTAEDEEIVYDCSTFIEKKNILVKGEYENDFKNKNNAIIVLFDCEKEGEIGGSRVAI